MFPIREKYTFAFIISDLLSIITVAVCLVSKVPQIIRVFKVKSAVGINLCGLLLELFSYTIMFSYNYRNKYALLSYLEYPVLLIQEWILIYFVLHYKRMINYKASSFAALYILLFVGLFYRFIPRECIAFIVPFCTPIGCASKIMQLGELFRTKNSESVSAQTWMMSAFTNMTRIYTIYMDSADSALLLNFIVNAMLSSAIVVASYYFKTQQLPATKKPHKKIE